MSETNNLHPTRESWLTAAAQGLLPWFEEAGSPVKSPIRLAMGFPSSRALSLKKRTIGQCWDILASKDGTAEILISPVLDDAIEILGVVAHELGHAALGTKVGHRRPFARLMIALNLEGKATSTYPGETFKDRAAALLEDLGPLPHSRLDPAMRPVKKDGIRQMKCECDTCGYIARTTKKWIKAAGTPMCPTDRVPLTCDDYSPDEDDDGDED